MKQLQQLHNTPGPPGPRRQAEGLETCHHMTCISYGAGDGFECV